MMPKVAKKVAKSKRTPETKKVPSHREFDVIGPEEYVHSDQKQTTPYMSNYEYAALINARSIQLFTSGATPLIDLVTPEDYDVLNIATKEIKMGLPKLVVRRRLIDGSSEDYHLKDMILPRESCKNSELS